MFGTAQRAINAYTNVGLETGVEAADPHKLVLMLYEGALLALAEGKRHMASRDIAAKGRALSKAVMIIDNGLKASLDIKAGGELGERLAALYDYMSERLLQANLHNRPELIDEVSVFKDGACKKDDLLPTLLGGVPADVGAELFRRLTPVMGDIACADFAKFDDVLRAERDEKAQAAVTKRSSAAQSLPVEVDDKVKKVPGVTDAKVEVVWEPGWTKDRMSEAAKLQLGLW